MHPARLSSLACCLSLAACTGDIVSGLGSRSSALYLDQEGNACLPDQATFVSLEQGLGGDYAFPDCLKLEGDEIGVDVTLELDGVTFTLSDWLTKDGEPGEYIGFSISASDDVFYVVKTGGELHEGSAESWVHPEGTSGPEAPAISFVAVCVGEPVDDETPEDEPRDEPRPGCDASGCCEIFDCSHLDDECGVGAYEPDIAACVYQETGVCDPDREDSDAPQTEDPNEPSDDPSDGDDAPNNDEPSDDTGDPNDSAGDTSHGTPTSSG